jgi:ribonuclease E
MPLDAPQPEISAVPFTGEVMIEPGASLEQAVEDEFRAVSAGGDAGERNGRRRSRRGGRGRGSRPESEAVEGEPMPTDAEQAPQQRTRRPRHAHPVAEASDLATMPGEVEAVEQPAVTMEKEQPEAEQAATPAVSLPSPVAAQEPAPAEEPAAPAIDYSVTTEPVVVGTEVEADRPKRGGWWARAKATLSGG